MAASLDDEGKPMRISCGSWDKAAAAVDLLSAENSDLARKTIENFIIFLKFAGERYQAPDEIGLGYWPTIRLTWSQSSPPVEVEVFEDRYEFYGFAADATEIRHVGVIADTFPDGLKVLLDAAIPVPPVVIVDS